MMREITWKEVCLLRGPKNLNHQKELKQFLYNQRKKEAIYVSTQPRWLIEELLYAKFCANDLEVEYFI